MAKSMRGKLLRQVKDLGMYQCSSCLSRCCFKYYCYRFSNETCFSRVALNPKLPQNYFAAYHSDRLSAAPLQQTSAAKILQHHTVQIHMWITDWHRLKSECETCTLHHHWTETHRQCNEPVQEVITQVARLQNMFTWAMNLYFVARFAMTHTWSQKENTNCTK
jgi:hypothetical protein